MRGRNAWLWKRLLILAAILALALFLDSKLAAQPLTTPVNLIPDCMVFFDFTDNGNSAQFDNRFLGCKTWYVAYTSTGFPALTLTFQSAPDNNGAPGAWVAFSGTVVEGVNPNVAITQASTIMYGYYPWQRITLSGAVAGAGRRMRGTFYGYRQTPVATLIVGPAAAVVANQGTANTAVNRWPVYLSDGAVAQGTTANPLATGIEYYLGATANWTPAPACTSRAAIAIAGAGTTEIVAASGATSIRVCHLSLSMTGATNITLVQGTGVNCVVAPADITGAYQNVLSMALPFEGRSIVSTAASQALCITSTAAVAGGGFVAYAQY